MNQIPRPKLRWSHALVMLLGVTGVQAAPRQARLRSSWARIRWVAMKPQPTMPQLVLLLISLRDIIPS